MPMYFPLGSIIIIIIIIILTANWFISGGSVLQCKTGQYNRVQDNTNKTEHITQNNTKHSRQPYIRKITKRNK